ncbi:MAG: alpha/beta fold hydrolase [Pseudomonadota bacterium]
MSRAARTSSLVFVAGLLALGAAGGAFASPAASPAVQEQAIDFKAFTVTRLTLQDKDGPPVRYYLSKPAHKAPLVVHIQGSGCVPPFMKLGTPEQFSTIYSWLPMAQAGRYAVMAVDKPYQSDEPQQGPYGAAIGCVGSFNAHYSYEAWLATLKKALRHALTRPEVDPTRVLLIGVSEGGAMAAGLARALPEVTHVVLVGSSGPTQLYDFAVNIYASQDSDEVKLLRLRELDATFEAIRADPKSTSKYAWGHTYLRWSSFFAQSTLDNLAHAKARVYLASGMQDKSSPILSTEAMYAQLRVQGRDVTFSRVPMAGHGLVPDDRPMREGQKEYDAFMAWFERP